MILVAVTEAFAPTPSFSLLFLNPNKIRFVLYDIFILTDRGFEEQ